MKPNDKQAKLLREIEQKEEEGKLEYKTFVKRSPSIQRLLKNTGVQAIRKITLRHSSRFSTWRRSSPDILSYGSKGSGNSEGVSNKSTARALFGAGYPCEQEITEFTSSLRMPRTTINGASSTKLHSLTGEGKEASSGDSSSGGRRATIPDRQELPRPTYPPSAGASPVATKKYGFLRQRGRSQSESELPKPQVSFHLPVPATLSPAPIPMNSAVIPLIDLLLPQRGLPQADLLDGGETEEEDLLGDEEEEEEEEEDYDEESSSGTEEEEYCDQEHLDEATEHSDGLYGIAEERAEITYPSWNDQIDPASVWQVIRRKSETDELRKSKLAARLPSSNGNKKKKKKEKEKQELIASSSSVTSVVGARRRSSSVKQFTKTDMLPALDAPARQRAFSHTPKPQSMPRLHSSYSPRTNRKPAGGSNGGEDGEPQPTEGVPKHRRLLRSMSSRRGVLCSSSSNLPARPVHRSHKDKAKTKDQAKAKDQEEKRKKKKKKSGKKKKKETTSKTRPRGVSLDQKNRSYQEAAKEEEQERDSAQESSLSAKEERKLRELLRQEKKEIRRCKRERAKWKKVLQEEQRRGTAAEKILSNLYQPNTDNKLLQYFQSRTNLLDEASADFVLEQATSIGSNTDKKSKEQLSSSGSVEAETVTTTSSADELQELLQSLEIDKELMKELRNLRSQEELENLSDAQLRKLKFKYLAESQLKRSQVRKAKGGGPALGTFSSSIARTKGDNSNQQKTSGGNITDSSKSLKLSQFFKRKNSQTDSHQGGASPKLSRHPYHDKTTLDELPEDRAWGEKDGESSSLSSSPSSSSSSPSSSILSASTSFLSVSPPSPRNILSLSLPFSQKGDAGREAANHEQATWQRSTASSSGSSIQTASQTDSPNQPQHSNNNSYAEFSASSGQHRLRSSHRVRLNSLATQRDISRSPRTTSTNFSLEQKQHQASHPAQQDESEKERANKGGPQGEIDKEQKMDTESKINYYLLRAKELITQNYELRSKIQEMVVQTNILKTYLSNDVNIFQLSTAEYSTEEDNAAILEKMKQISQQKQSEEATSRPRSSSFSGPNSTSRSSLLSDEDSADEAHTEEDPTTDCSDDATSNSSYDSSESEEDDDGTEEDEEEEEAEDDAEEEKERLLTAHSTEKRAPQRREVESYSQNDVSAWIPKSWEEASNEEDSGEVMASGYRAIPFDDLTLEEPPIGFGAFGVVYRASWRGAHVAVKKLLVVLNEEQYQQFLREAAIMERVSNHPNIADFCGITLAKPHFCIVGEYYENGNIADYLRQHPDTCWKQIVKVALCAAAGVLHLHKEFIIHRDLAARNLLVDSNLNVHVSDFGLARTKLQTFAKTTGNIGAIKWLAPEAISTKNYSEKSDSYSFGVVLYELASRGKEPYEGENIIEIALGVSTGKKRPSIPEDCPLPFCQLMEDCWRQDPSERPDFREIWTRLNDYYNSLMMDSDAERKLSDPSTFLSQPHSLPANTTDSAHLRPSSIPSPSSSPSLFPVSSLSPSPSLQ
ncbi:Nucleolar protein with MIF4G domain 1 [Balamuthia mandrillaris]